MTVKQIYERTVFGTLTPAAIKDYNTLYCGGGELYLEMYKKGLRKNAARKYLNIVQLLNREAVVVKSTNTKVPVYTITTIRTPLENNEEVFLR